MILNTAVWKYGFKKSLPVPSTFTKYILAKLIRICDTVTRQMQCNAIHCE